MYLYLKISNEIRKDIEQNKFEKKLPSIRQFMNYYGVSQSTVIKALELLKVENYVYVKKNNGYYLVSKKETVYKNDYIDFSTTSTSWTKFPLDDYSKCLEQVINQKQRNLFRYGSEKGEDSLRQQFQEVLLNQFIYTNIDKLVITSGSQQALHILALMIIKEKAKILIEQPTYHHMINMVETMDVKYVTYEHNLKEFDIDKFEEVVKNHNPRFVYLMPRLHNPLGISLSERNKLNLVEFAEKYDFYIIEDDYMGDFITTTNNKTLYELDKFDRVFYLKSFSKVMFPGQRIAVSIVPYNYMNEFSNFKKIIDIQTNTLSQFTMTLFIESGMYDYHVKKIVDEYKKKSVKLQDSLKKHMYMYQFNINQNMHTIIKLPKRTNMNKLYKKFEEEKLLIDDYRLNYLKKSLHKPKFIKLNIMNTDESRIDKGICKIKKCIELCLE
ncbi:PLP-dependent aminotransferase family protein [Macrococcoides bohemicum]|uniref:aminotransferase-like domain-containing protein n=1 Tax=Macrococcoides bohemicum TaxID=1903056 RepID=UPI00165D3B44|nr:PLP-dependent aminotransferase family protein [Macrococcus bohemicus]MBC9873922.1 PLP-dependent aminotransferase family protein [Macrococcus bohemicus]